MTAVHDFILGMPKAELHLHLEGTLSPTLMLALAERNRVRLPHSSLEELTAAYRIRNQQSLLDLPYQGARVLCDERDYYDLTWQYLLHCKRDRVLHTEPSFAPQTHAQRGVPFEALMNGTLAALRDARAAWGLSSRLVMRLQSHLGVESAMRTLEAALPWKEHIAAVALDSSELSHPPSTFVPVFARARAEGFKVVAHAGEEEPPEYIWEAIRSLQAQRIDHGVRVAEDQRLLQYLRECQLPLTVCPLSNAQLRMFARAEDHNVLELLDAGLCITVNSDDPEYFGGYLNDNFVALINGLHLTERQALQLAQNSFRASFLPESTKAALQYELEVYSASLESG